nr:MAG TPA: Protein of unknown function (DUF2829) [Caudoviricetes sp.]
MVGGRKVQWHNQDIDLLSEDWETLDNGDLQK